MQQKIQGFPLSPQQKHLWLVQQGSNLYRNQCAVLIEGDLQVEILKEALEKVIARNEILRTNIHRPRGLKIPIQVIDTNSKIFLNEYDLGNHYSQDEEIEALFDKIRDHSVKLEKGQLLKIDLVKCSAKKYVLFINLPSICTDYKTFKNIVYQISQYYTACLQNTEIDEETLQYADVATWQNELLEAEETTTRTNFWQQVDFSALDNLKLAFENCFSQESEFDPQVIKLVIHSDLLTKIEEIIQKYQISINIFFLTCWQILLWRLSGQSNLIVGVGCDGRNYEELKAALGLFGKYLPLVYHLQENYTFSDTLIQVKKLTDEMLEWQDSFSWNAFGKTDTDDIEQAFLPFCYDFEETIANYYAPQVSFSIHQHYVCVDRFKLKLSCVRTQNDLVKVEFHYDAKLFHKEDIENLASQWQTLLSSIINNPSLAISRLDILSEQEREKLLLTFNNTKTAELEYKCIHHWFEEQCDRTPDNIAVIYNNQQLSYQELNTRANQLAHYLQQLGVKPDVMVGICVERSLSMIIALLAILKAGGAYVPIDPAYPAERIGLILQSSQVSVLLTQQHLIENLPKHQTQVVCLETDRQTIAQQSQTNPISNCTADNLAYIIYTSGSTGQPKGVLINHANVVRLLAATDSWYNFNQQDVWTLFHSIAFDFSVWEIWGALLYGGKLIVVPYLLSRSPQDFYQLLLTQQVTILNQTPSAFRQLIQVEESLGNNNDLKLRAVIFGGEALQIESLRPWFERHGDQFPQLVNMYGITETTVHVTYRPLTMADLELASASVIGRPIPDLQVYLLDSYQQPVPIGIPGELHVGGVGLARGYLNQPELTAQRFIPNPFSDKEGDRLYKTGDLVRFLPNGDMEYIGRIDNQIKIRGFRVELGEIEATIIQHPSVSASVVMLRENKPGNQSLIAYIILHPDKTLTIPELRRFLQNKLLDHMVPTAFMILKAFPLTSNGKIDHRALPMPDALRPELEVAYVVPQTEVEKTIASVWQKALNIEKIGIHDNFFEIGGHSLLLVTVHSQLQEILNAELSTLDLFRYPTINSLAEYLSSSANQTAFLQETDIQIEKISDGKAQQRKRLQKIKSVENN
ncbi:amino acid adenylation domain-containing protein [Desmonostoc muscorum LEGE 12446]|uniref:Amino acid adenylation domain-containing protein n=1 Tax=Desmonostoc muscorum LEGE 12446 TaxID=1828758 RepID=A0A8J6ZNY0_DESMC|nr:non-ribosomal peptide synthetase [Desmonostoc muscorum]MCF2149913.1 amino acid adenylation domain-containing protein [Desmonostoc muscorum LEGE 12446]